MFHVNSDKLMMRKPHCHSEAVVQCKQKHQKGLKAIILRSSLLSLKIEPSLLNIFSDLGTRWGG
jgi:hypothetical protein